ncbi:MAG: hypothetical protein SFZ02_04875 [bacterium]|nr:hypothetical protein [bacterium]
MWNWLIHPKEPYTWGFIARVVIKATLLFIVFNLLFAFLRPMDFINRLTLYNGLFAGRERFPYSDNPPQDYAITTDNIPAMFASHIVSRPKADDEYRVIILGNSATWGYWVSAYDAIAPQLTDQNYLLGDGKRVVAYNLAYPNSYLSRDLIFLEEVMQYQPDMVIWFVTMGSFLPQRQIDFPLIRNNAQRMRSLIEAYDLYLDPQDPRFNTTDFFGQTIIGQRRTLSLWLQTQLYGVMWQSTGIDQFIEAYQLRPNDLENNLSWQGFEPPINFTEQDLAFDFIRVGQDLAGDLPIIIVNQPMFIATGQNSDVRYNDHFPRGAYDSYRALIANLAVKYQWQYCDLWDALPNESFTDTPLHMTAQGTGELARMIGEMITDYLEFGYLGKECE